MSNTYYDRSAGKEWNKLLFLTGRYVQSAELNELQSILEEYQSRFGRVLFKDGDVISGCQVAVPDIAAGEATITSGYIFLDGRIRKVSGKNSDNPLIIAANGEEEIGLKKTITYITEDDDETLRNPVENWGTYGTPGAHREVYEYEWVVDDEDAVTIFKLIDGKLKVIDRPTVYSQLYDLLARRTYDESGHYSVNKFLMRAEEDTTDTTKWTLVVEPSKAYVKGYEVELGASQRIEIDKGRDYATVESEFVNKSEYSNLYELNENFVRTVEAIGAPVLKEISISRGGIRGTKDQIPYTPLFKIIAVNQGGTWDSNNEQYVGGTDFTEGVDFFQEGNFINWELGADEPNPGTTYRIAFLYTKTLVKGTRSIEQTEVVSVTRDATANIDWLSNEDGIQNFLDITDQNGNALNQYRLGVDYEFITGNNPQHNYITGKNYSTTIGKCGIYWYPDAQNKPSGTYYVIYSYWKHDIEGDFISADSYENYELITRNYRTLLEYRDYIDFRPTETISKTDTVYNGENFNVYYTYYIPRIDLIYLDQFGDIKTVKGTASKVPNPPSDIDDVLTLGWAYIPEYTYELDNIKFTYKESLRYTMQDIRRLEERIDRIEYFTTLELLEQDALNTLTETVKKGVFIDSFHGSKNSDLKYDDGTNIFSIAFDQKKHSIKLKAIVDQENLELDNIQTTAKLNRFSYSLPFQEEIFTEQLFATDSITVQPFEVYVHKGELSFDPEAINFVDTQQAADVLVDFEGQNQHIREIDIGTAWGFWEDTSVGRMNVTETIEQENLEPIEFPPPTEAQVRQFNPSRELGVNINEIRARELARQMGIPFVEQLFGLPRFGQSERRTRAESFPPIALRENVTIERGFQQVTQERSGVNFSLMPENLEINLGERVVNAAIAASVPQQEITIYGSQLRPNVDNIELFFDGEIVNVYDQNPSSMYTGKIATNERGEFSCKIVIPEGTKVGRREIKATNENTAPDTEQTIATGVLECYGIAQTKAEGFSTISVPNLRTTETSERRSIRRFAERVIERRQEIVATEVGIRGVTFDPIDPIAQSFISDKEELIYISSIDVFFKQKPSGNDKTPVTIFLRSVENGYPTNKIIASSTVNVEDVNTSNDASIPTNFLFNDPIMVDPSVELCFVVYSTSPAYEVFYAELGEDDIETGSKVVKNPHSGVFFTSANSSTWQADGFKDLKFRIYKCNFENDCQLVFRNISGKEAGTIILQTSQMVPDACAIKWFYSRNNGQSYTAIDPLNTLELKSLLTEITLRADITGEGLSPLIHKDRLGIIFVKYESEGHYISKKLDLGNTCNSIKIRLDGYIPREDDVVISVYYQINEDNVWRKEWDDDDSFYTFLDEKWDELTYSVQNLPDFETLRIKISLSTNNEVISPECRRLRVVAY